MTQFGVMSLLAALCAVLFVVLMEYIDMRARGFWSRPERWFIGFMTYAVASIVIADLVYANAATRPYWMDNALVVTAVGSWLAAMIALVRMTAGPSR